MASSVHPDRPAVDGELLPGCLGADGASDGGASAGHRDPAELEDGRGRGPGDEGERQRQRDGERDAQLDERGELGCG